MMNDGVFLQACRRERTPYTPIWLMRQAGRYMPSYRKIRDKVPFLKLCKDKDLVTEVTVHAQEKIGADTAIIFSDILLVAEAFGLGLEYLKGGGPKIHRPVQSRKDVDAFRTIDTASAFPFLFQAIRQTRKALKPNIALIGFAGAPFTLASYMIEGGSSRDFKKTKLFMKKEPTAWKILMEKIVTAVADCLNGQIQAGADAVQLFDSWVGCLSAAEYRKSVMPYSKKLIGKIKKGAPVIHFGTGTGKFLEDFAAAGGDVISVDHHIRLGQAWRKIGYHRAIQGNLDPQVLCGPLSEIKRRVSLVLKEAAGRPGHIFNLGHGVLLQTPEKNVIALVKMVHELSRK